MAGTLAIIAGRGALPQEIARTADDPLFVTLEGIDVDVPPGRHLHASFEKLGALFKGLAREGIEEVVLAGAITRPQLRPTRFDLKTVKVVPKVLASMGKGDDTLLRAVIEVFEAEGLRLRGPHEVAPGLVLRADQGRGGAPDKGQSADIARADAILAALADQDVAQSVVVEGGLCLGIETIQGTDAMLRFVAETPAHLRRAKGVFVKRPKPGQDLRVDMPTIGPATIAAVAHAGLAGLSIAAGKVIVLEQETVFAGLAEHGLFLEIR